MVNSKNLPGYHHNSQICKDCIFRGPLATLISCNVWKFEEIPDSEMQSRL